MIDARIGCEEGSLRSVRVKGRVMSPRQEPAVPPVPILLLSLLLLATATPAGAAGDNIFAGTQVHTIDIDVRRSPPGGTP